MDTSKIVVEATGLTKVYGSKTAVDNISFAVDRGEIFGFLGPNGAGKTTTVLMMLGLTEPSAGRVKVMGLDPRFASIKVKQKVGYLPENVGFYGDLTGRQNLLYVARLNGLTDKVAHDRIDRALDAVGLKDEGDKRAAAYSRGMRQRLGIAELLIREPDIVFLDEPTLGLDPDGINRMISLIQSLSLERNMTVLLSSHQLHQVQRICRRVGIMIKGKLVAVGTIDELAKEKLGVEQDTFTLEEIYMKYFKEA
ncbi:MAG: ABC transporter ATP-binding protein [Deltaproteobacteria bacterium]|nr:ABC transporter ATP-binding protein [Deltaproteobacteria bacterium]